MAKKNPEIPTLTERIQEYLRTVKPPEEEVKLTWSERVGLGLFRKVSDFFNLMWEKVFDNFRKALSGIVSDLFKLFFKQITTVATPGIKEALIEVIKLQYYPVDTETDLIKRTEKGTPFDYVATWIYSVASEVMRLIAIMSASHEKARQEQYKVLQPSLPGLGDVLISRFRDPKYEPIIDDYMKRMGLNEDTRNMMRLVSWTLLNPDQVRELYLRGEISKSERDKRLQQLGIQNIDTELLEKLYYFIPSPTDLVRMAVREAFTPEIAEKFGQYEDFPKPFADWAKKQGMSEFWAKAYWASHWGLPSPMQGYEMLHRGVIKMDTFKMLLRALDVMPFWRDKLIAISYSPYTRIDIRRMFRTGIVNKEEVYRTYLDLGYDDEHARNLTAFTVKDALEKERDLTKADILSAYTRKIMKRSEAKEYLMSLKYSSDEAEIYLDRIDYDTAKKIKDKELSWIKKNYVGSLITYDEARNRLSTLDLGGDEITELFRDWDIEREGKIAELTFKQLQTLLINKIIDETKFKQRLRDKRYTEEDIKLLVELTKKKVVEG